MNHTTESLILRRPRRRVRRWCLCIKVGAVAAVCLGLAGCPREPGKQAAGAGGGPRAGAKPAPVRVAAVVQKSMSRQIRTFGTGEAYATVAVKSLVAGQVTEIAIQPGQQVKQGELLFTIDPRPFQATLKQLEAVQTRDQVLAAEAQRQAALATDLRQRGVNSEDEMRKAKAAAAALEAALLADQADIEKARLDLEYCTIHAPLTGRAGDLLVRVGGVVKANDVTLVEIAQTMPLYVAFAVPEIYLPAIRAGLSAGGLSVEAIPRGATEPVTGGELVFVDNTVNTETGTIRLKATFPNQEEKLWPGQFLEIVLTLARDEASLVIPSQAVQDGQAGTFTFVLRADQTVEMRPLTVGRTQGDEAVISAGLKAGELVVIDGQIRLVPNAKVEVVGPDGKGETRQIEARQSGAGGTQAEAAKAARS
jgi:membrane fusion protein, multidrug efflux system